jgi:hypothetical protein
MKTTKMILFTALFAVAALAQTTVTYTAPVGASSYARVTPYQEWYSNLVENSTPPYPNPLQPGNFQMPAFPNHSLTSVAAGLGTLMTGFVSPDGLYTANLQAGSSIGWFRIGNGLEAVEIDNIVWTVPTVYPDAGAPAEFSMDATVIQVCAATCSSASGTFHLDGQWAYQWNSFVSHGCRSCGRWNNVEKVWTNTSPVVVTINDQSTVAILD